MAESKKIQIGLDAPCPKCGSKRRQEISRHHDSQGGWLKTFQCLDCGEEYSNLEG